MTSVQRRAPEGSDSATRQQLLEATRRLLSGAGGSPITSRSIADEAGANLAAITYYFGSKDELIAEAMLVLARARLEPVIDVLARTGEPISKMLEAVALLNTAMAEHAHEASAYVQVLAAGASGAPIAGALRDLLRTVAGLLAEQIETQQRAGALPPWVAPGVMAQTIIALVHGTLIAAVLDDEHADHVAMSAQFAQLLLAARAEPAADGRESRPPAEGTESAPAASL